LVQIQPLSYPAIGTGWVALCSLPVGQLSVNFCNQILNRDT
jgi:hypothetical protein